MEQKSKKEEPESIQLKNPNISHVKTDFLYHLGLGNKTHNLPKMFGDVKVSCLLTTVSAKALKHYCIRSLL